MSSKKMIGAICKSTNHSLPRSWKKRKIGVTSPRLRLPRSGKKREIISKSARKKKRMMNGET